MIFASRVQKTIPIPGDPSHTVTIQKLPRRHFISAEKEQQATVTADLRKQFGEEWQDQVKKFKTDDATPDLKKAAKDPLLRFDVPTLLRFGVVGWSLDEPFDVSLLEDLGKEDAEYIASAVLRLSAPKLFEDEEGGERKNDSAPSTAA